MTGRAKPIIFRPASPEQRAQIEASAAQEGMKLSEFLRSRATITPEWLAQQAGIPVATARERLSARGK